MLIPLLVGCRCRARCQLVNSTSDGRDEVDFVDVGREEDSGLALLDGNSIARVVEVGEENMCDFPLYEDPHLDFMVFHILLNLSSVAKKTIVRGVLGDVDSRYILDGE